MMVDNQYADSVNGLTGFVMLRNITFKAPELINIIRRLGLGTYQRLNMLVITYKRSLIGYVELLDNVTLIYFDKTNPSRFIFPFMDEIREYAHKHRHKDVSLLIRGGWSVSLDTYVKARYCMLCDNLQRVDKDKIKCIRKKDYMTPDEVAKFCRSYWGPRSTSTNKAPDDTIRISNKRMKVKYVQRRLK